VAIEQASWRGLAVAEDPVAACKIFRTCLPFRQRCRIHI